MLFREGEEGGETRGAVRKSVVKLGLEIQIERERDGSLRGGRVGRLTGTGHGVSQMTAVGNIDSKFTTVL